VEKFSRVLGLADFINKNCKPIAVGVVIKASRLLTQLNDSKEGSE